MKRFVVSSVLAALVLACGSQAPKPAQPLVTGEPAATEPAPAAEPAPAPAPPPEPTQQELIAQTIERVGEIQSVVAEMRGLPFKSDVPAAYQGKEDFRAFVKSELAKEFPQEKSDRVSRAVFHLGLLREELDLASIVEDAFVSQAGAYYDPDQKKFFFLMLSPDLSMLETIAAHELVHAIQDQHFDLRALYGEKDGGTSTLDSDTANARRFLVEGEATLVMIGFQTKAATQLDLFDPKNAKQLEMAIAMMGAADATQMAKMQKQQMSNMSLGEDFEAAVEAMDKIPPFVLVPLFESYTRGAMVATAAYLAGGWKAVDALYADPPSSTEQVLHPREKLIGQRDYPIAIALTQPKALKGWEEADSDVMGELQWRVYFDLWEVPEAAKLAAGWDGDRYAVYTQDAATAAIIATTWDSVDEAKEFEQGYLASLAKRFEGVSPGKRGPATTASRPDGSDIVVRRQGADVYIVDGAPKGKGGAVMRELMRAKKTKHASDK